MSQEQAKRHDPFFKRDLLKLACLLVSALGLAALFFLTPTLSTPTTISIVATMLLSPTVAWLERRGVRRSHAITLLFLALAGALGSVGTWTFRSGNIEWTSLKEKAPAYFSMTLERLRNWEAQAKQSYPFLEGVKPTDAIMEWGRSTGDWFLTNGPALAGELVTCLFIAPILTFVLLLEGRQVRRRFFELVPNRVFEVLFLVLHEVLTSMSDYLRAKLLEAFLVGLMTGIGLAAVGAPFAIVLGVLAGVTNILPYVGPLIGAVPGLAVVAFDPSLTHLIWPVLMVYAIANLVDTVVIFPVVVAKLVNLHPLILIAVVALGQQYYGLIGMLISIPVATTLKVILVQAYSAIYEQRGLPSSASIAAGNSDYGPLLGEEL